MQRFLNFIPGKGRSSLPWRMVTLFSDSPSPKIETFPPSVCICEHVSLVVDDDGKGWLEITDDNLAIVAPVK